MDTSTARKISESVTEEAPQTYQKATDWLQQNYGKTIGALGVIAAVGMIGYFLAKSNEKDQHSLS